MREREKISAEWRETQGRDVIKILRWFVHLVLHSQGKTDEWLA